MTSCARLLALVGPTASGKSTLAVRAAAALGGEIVNCDSMQMYRYMDIGTAKPTREQQQVVPHHFYDTIDPDEFYSAGRYMSEARKICREIAARRHVVLVVGGTGLYLRALLEGIFKGPGRSREIRKRLNQIAERRGTSYLYRLLKKRDPAAEKVQQGDRTRIIRALEVYFLTGKPISMLQPRRVPFSGFSILKVGLTLPREVLYDRINRRVREMFHGGLLDEVSDLLDHGYAPDSKGFEALGYRHAVGVLEGKVDVEDAIDLSQRDTRRYAKRQLTWFRREPDVHWIEGPGEAAGALEQLLERVKQFWSGRASHSPLNTDH